MTFEFNTAPECARLKEWMNALKSCHFRTFKFRTFRDSELEVLSMRLKAYTFFHIDIFTTTKPDFHALSQSD
jgi:hypothetical protein